MDSSYIYNRNQWAGAHSIMEHILIVFYMATVIVQDLPHHCGYCGGNPCQAGLPGVIDAVWLSLAEVC